MKAVIFDMDGVIIDSEILHTKTKIETLAEYGIECSREQCLPYFGRSANDFFGDFIRRSGKDISLEKIVARKHELFLNCAAESDNVPAIDGVVELITKLHENGVPLALASSSARRNIETFLKKLNIFSYFNVILSGAELPESKPNPAIYLLAADKLGMAPCDCVVFEDAAAGVIAAKKAGCYCIAYCNPDYKMCQQDVSAADMKIDSFRKISVGYLAGLRA
ncbi:HAD family hydrolase [Pectinatus sottacetonis]|uniref:HAD family hydrolase n=1 Tax=Pectinatus sottacetonis TaxID=1002795 RepID=UPI0018C66D8E|nr:HAD family phosphatase [Pectinatus sottacetonis]